MNLKSSACVPASAATVRATFENAVDLLDGVDAVSLTPTGPGEWEMQVEMGGQTQTGTLHHVETVGDRVRHEAFSGGIAVHIVGTCAPTGDDQTNLTVDVEFKAKSMKAKMLLPALALAKSRIETGLDKALGKLARRIGDSETAT